MTQMCMVREEYSGTERESSSSTGQLNCGPHTNEKETNTTQKSNLRIGT